MGGESVKQFIRPEQKAAMGPTIPLQTWALIKRYLITLIRSPISSLIRILLWPGFLLGLSTYLLTNIEDGSYSEGINFLTIAALLIVYLIAFHVYHFAQWFVADRSTKMKSLMISMGLKRFSYYLGNSICFMMLVLPLMIAVGVLLLKFLMQDSKISPVIIMIVLILFVVHLVGFLFAITSFITSTNYTPLIFLITILEPFFHQGVLWMMKNSSATWRPLILFVSSVLPYESIRILFNSYTLCKNCGTTEFDEEKNLVAQPVYLILLAMSFWTVVSFAFSRWFEEVCPWQDDSAVKGPLFCLKCSQESNQDLSDPDSDNSRGSKYFEKSAGQREVGIRISKVTKTFRNIAVVNDLSFSIYKGETTLLLGHNGAGKTTLMNIILGKLSSDRGKVLIKQPDAMTNDRESVGVCPQTSILDDNLTVKQHLDFFAGIKSSGMSSHELDSHIKTTIKDVSLTSHMYKLPSELSGGMKRKLSLAMAFVGKSSILILDEPSSGLDPDSRVSVWNVIRRYRADRTVLLSTQHMEEADYLGDRIAIMSSGKIICCGSSIFLNRIFGNGYKLRVECNASKQKEILAFVRKYFPSAKPSEVDQAVTPPASSSKTDPTQDMVIELTDDKAKDSEMKLIKMLEEIENRSRELHMKSHGLKSSSLEDVLLNTSKSFANTTTDSVHLNLAATNGHIATLTSPIHMPNETTTLDFFHFLQSFLVKHFYTHLRDWPTFIFYRLFVPTACVAWFVTDLNIPPGGFTPDFQAIFMISHYIYYPTSERVSKFKTMQLTSHATFTTYWLAQYLADLVSILVLAININIFLVVIFNGEFLASRLGVHLIATGAFILFGSSAAFLAYLMSTIISNSKGSIGYHILFYCFSIAITGIVGILSIFVSPKFDSVKNVLETIFIAVLPPSSLRYIFYGLKVNCYVKSRFDVGANCGVDYWSPIAAGLVALSIQVLVYGGILYVIESQNIDLSSYLNIRNSFCCKNKNLMTNVGRDIDKDVVDESTKVAGIINNVPSEQYSLVAANLSKSYVKGNKVVDHLSFAANRGECFGLLGVNGAGKTTTFSMIVAEIPLDEGRIWMNGCYLSKNVDKYRQRLGFDPQESPEMSLTPIQALHLMARLRRINELSIPMLVSSTLELLEMTEHASKTANDLSGGTKRKLSLGMSLIGNPSLMALDEPTAGVDPIARRSIWQLLRALRMQNGASIIISSHAMEECEAICDRISIMARGQLRCIGSFLHLRSKFAQGCSVRIQFSTSGGSNEIDSGNVEIINKSIQELKRALESAFGASAIKLADTNINSATFNILDKNVRRSSLFKLLREFRQKHPSISYMINDSSLEDIFISLAREQQQLESQATQ